MARKNRVKVNIEGAVFWVVTELSEAEIASLSNEVREHIERMKRLTPGTSDYMVAVMTALSYCQNMRYTMKDSSDANEQISVYTERIRIAREEVDKARAELIISQEKLNSANRRNTQLQNDVDTARSEAAHLRDQLEDVTLELEIFKEEQIEKQVKMMGAASSEVQNASKKIDELSSLLVAKTEQLESVSAQNDQAQTELTRSHETIDELTRRVEELQTELDSIKKKKYLFKR